MPEPLQTALAEVRALLLDPDGLRGAVAAGRRRGAAPRWVRVRFRPVSLASGPHLQVVTYDEARPYTRNVAWGRPAEAAIDELLAEPYGNWHVTTDRVTLQLRVTKRGLAQVHRAPAPGGDGTFRPGTRAATAPVGATAPDAGDIGDAGTARDGRRGGDARRHDREKEHLIDPGDPLFDVIGGTAAKRRQVDAFLRALAATIDPDALPGPVRVVDLGCGNAYLTFAAYRYLTGLGLDVRLVGVDVRDDQRQRNTDLARRLGWQDRVRFVAGTIATAGVDLAPRPGGPPVDIVLALHACDTATDEALARAIGWRATYLLAAPCCHHDIASQLRHGTGPAPYRLVTAQPILRERFADVLTDSLRAALLRLHGYRVDVVEFVDSTHTPRNLLLRARRTGAPPTADQQADYQALVAEWGVTPRLATLLGGAQPAG